MMANCSMQNVTEYWGSNIITTQQWICTYPPRPKFALDPIFLYIFIGMFLVGLIYMVYKYRKTHTFDNSEEETGDNDIDEEEIDDEGTEHE